MKRIRVGGQRSVHPSTASVNEERLANKKKKKKISLSDFLQRKLPPPHKSLQGKDTPFLSPGPGTTAASVYAHHKTKGMGLDLNGTLDTVLQHFKPNKQENAHDNLQHSIQGSTATHVTKESQIQDPGKQLPGVHGKPFAPKGVVILGGDPMLKQAKYPKSFIRKEKAPPVYNHYASGSGWWDSDMEGVDNDEVGFNEVWEGVGSATIGGLDWH